MVIVTFGTQRFRPSVWSPVTISYGISSSSVLSLVWLLILVVPGGVIRLSFVVSLTRSAQVLIFLSMSLVANSMASCIVFGLVAITLPWIVSGKFLETSDRTLVPVLGNVGYRLPHRYPLPSNSTFRTPIS
ncbi:hypothetical protein Tco_0203182 [Tanacetum coccineum]